MQFQVTKENKRTVIGGMYLSGVLLIIIIILFTFIFPSWIVIIMVVFIYGFVDIGPGIYLYNEYLKFNKGAKFEIHTGQGMFKYYDGDDKLIESTYRDIKQIDVYLPPNRYGSGGFQFISMEAFLYARFTLNDGREFYITCLMVPKLKDFVRTYFANEPATFHRWWLFASIRLCNYFRKKKGLKKQELS
jgi:hypothetical protein